MTIKVLIKNDMNPEYDKVIFVEMQNKDEGGEWKPVPEVHVIKPSETLDTIVHSHRRLVIAEATESKETV